MKNSLKISNSKKYMLNIFAVAIIVYGVSIIAPILASLYYNETLVSSVLSIISLVSIITGVTIRWLIDCDVRPVRPRICYMTVLFTWLILILITSFSFYFSIERFKYIDALLEATASLTTTGIGIADITTLAHGLQLWRSICNWLGGIGIIMTTLSILPAWQFLGQGLAVTEFPGPTFLKKNSTFNKGYRKLVMIYAGLTALHFVLLVIAGMPAFESLLTALSNTSTSGLQHFNNGVVTNFNLPIKLIITVFALLGSVNGNLFFLFMRKKFRSLLSQSELVFYFWRVLLTGILITVFIIAADHSLNIFKVFGDVIMQTIAFISTSGYIITDCDKWPAACQLFILLQMFIGSCAVSTGGGIKVARIIIAFKTVSFSIFRHIHPKSVRTLKFNGEPMNSDQVIRANLFIAMFMVTYLLGALMLSFDNMNLYDALNYSQAMLTNTGASIGELASPGLAAGFSPFSKVSMCVLMIAGRLEIYPIFMLFMRSFWVADHTR